MRSLNIVTGATIDTDSDTDATSPVDMTTQDHPFQPGATAVAAIALIGVDGGTPGVHIAIEKSELGSGDTDWEEVGSVDVADITAASRTVFLDGVQIGQRMRATSNGGSAAAGSYDVTLLSN